MKLYIAGPVTDDDCAALRKAGFDLHIGGNETFLKGSVVRSPLRQCVALYAAPGWLQTPAASQQVRNAQYIGLPVYERLADVLAAMPTLGTMTEKKICA